MEISLIPLFASLQDALIVKYNARKRFSKSATMVFNLAFGSPSNDFDEVYNLSFGPASLIETVDPKEVVTTNVEEDAKEVVTEEGGSPEPSVNEHRELRDPDGIRAGSDEREGRVIDLTSVKEDKLSETINRNVDTLDFKSQVGSSRFSWRLDPKESLSDWEINVVHTDSGKSDLYNVHRMVLAAGRKQSGYFEDLFLQRMDNHNGHRLRLEMPDELASVFPIVLDYMYDDFDIASVQKRKQAFRLYEQAEYFQIPGLKAAVTDWFQQRLQWFDVPRFLQDIEHFGDAFPLRKVAMSKCIENFEHLQPNFAGKIGPVELLEIFENLHSSAYKFDQRGFYIAALVLECKMVHQLDREMFLELTDEKFLPVVPMEAAMQFLTFEAESRNSMKAKLSCLEKRCVRSLVNEWDAFCHGFDSPEAVVESITELPTAVLSKLLVRIGTIPPKQELA